MGTSLEKLAPQIKEFLGEAMGEMKRAVGEYGIQGEIADERWLAVVVEELGEAAQALNDLRQAEVSPHEEGRMNKEIRVELAQMVGMVVLWVVTAGEREKFFEKSNRSSNNASSDNLSEGKDPAAD